jgi:rubrerythrin
MTKTESNLEKAIAGEAKARLEYMAFAMQAMQEGYPQIAQLFMEAAGAETIHGINHMRAAKHIGSTFENLDEAANGEDYEIEQMYPSFLHEAVEEGREDAAASFHLALEREKHHRAMFKIAFEEFKAGLIEQEYMLPK